MRQTFTHVHWMRKTFTRIHKMSDASNIYTYTPISFKRQVVFHWSSRLPVFSFTNSHALNQRQSLNTEGTHGSFPFTRKPRTGKWPHALTAQRYNLWASLVQQRLCPEPHHYFFQSLCLWGGPGQSCFLSSSCVRELQTGHVGKWIPKTPPSPHYPPLARANA